MKKLILLLLLAGNLFAQPDMCKIYVWHYDFGTNPAVGKRTTITVTEAKLNNVAIPQYTGKNFIYTNSGYHYLYVPQGALIKIVANVFNFTGQTFYTIASSDSIDLMSLQAWSGSNQDQAGFAYIDDSPIQGNDDTLFTSKGITKTVGTDSVTLALTTANLDLVTIASGDTLFLVDVTDGEVKKGLVSDISGLSGAPTDATYITKSPNGSLSAEIATNLLTHAELADGDTVLYLDPNDSGNFKKGVYYAAGGNAQPLDAGLTDVAGLAVTDGNIIVGNGTNWVAESGATARTSLGVDAAGTDNSTNVTLAGTPAYITLSEQEITRLPIRSIWVDSSKIVTHVQLAAAGYITGISGLDPTDLDGGNWKVFYTDGEGDVTELSLGSDGTFLRSNGATSAPTFATLAGSGDVSKVGTPANNQVGVWIGDGTLEGNSEFVWVADTSLVISSDADSFFVRLYKSLYALDLEVGNSRIFAVDSVGNITLSGTIDGKDIATNAAMLNEAETIGANWVNTENPWAENEIVSTVLVESERTTATRGAKNLLAVTGSNNVVNALDYELNTIVAADTLVPLLEARLDAIPNLTITESQISDLGTYLTSESDPVISAIFNAQTILHATSDNTPVALTISEQTVVGRLTGGNIAAIALGIADNNVMQVDGTLNAGEYVRVTASGFESRTESEFKGDFNLAIGTNVQAFDADLTTYAGITPSANVQTLLGAADFAAFKTSLSLNSVENTALSTWAGSANLNTFASEGVNTSEVEAELKTDVKGFTVYVPIATTVVPLFKTSHAITITEIAGFTDTGTATFNIEQRAETTPNTAGTDVMSADVVADNNQQEQAGFNDATVPANTWLVAVFSAVATNPGFCHATVRFTID